MNLNDEGDLDGTFLFRLGRYVSFGVIKMKVMFPRGKIVDVLSVSEFSNVILHKMPICTLKMNKMYVILQES